jgi:hypothetical protein
MQVCRTLLAIGYTITAVEEPMAVVGMWEESRKWSIGVGAFGNWTSRAFGIRFYDRWHYWLCRRFF